MVTQSDEFIKLLTENQYKLRAFILASLGDHTNTADVLQQTNVVLWQKAGDLASHDEFLPWALSVARYKVLAFVRDRGRDRLIFGASVAESISNLAEERIGELSFRQQALRQCLEKTPDRYLGILREKYVHGLSLQQIASSTDRTMGAIKSVLKRARRQLATCVEQRLNASDC